MGLECVVGCVCLCDCGCWQACTTTLNQNNVMGGGGEGGRGAVDNGWEGDNNNECSIIPGRP